jgi:hypothetical protein
VPCGVRNFLLLLRARLRACFFFFRLIVFLFDLLLWFVSNCLLLRAC